MIGPAREDDFSVGRFDSGLLAFDCGEEHAVLLKIERSIDDKELDIVFDETEIHSLAVQIPGR